MIVAIHITLSHGSLFPCANYSHPVINRVIFLIPTKQSSCTLRSTVLHVLLPHDVPIEYTFVDDLSTAIAAHALAGTLNIPRRIYCSWKENHEAYVDCAYFQQSERKDVCQTTQFRLARTPQSEAAMRGR